MAATYATTDDVEASWRTLTVDEMPVAATFIDWVSARVRRRVPNLDTRIAADEEDLELLTTAAVAEIVTRALKNPEGWREEAIDDYRRVRDAAVSSGALYVAADDVEDLMPRAALSGAYSVPLGGPDVWSVE